MKLSFVQLGEAVAGYIARHPGWNEQDIIVDCRSRGIGAVRISRALERLVELGWVHEKRGRRKGASPQLYYVGPGAEQGKGRAA